MPTVHKTVLLKETVDCLNLKQGDRVVDATLNAGGHTREILSRLKDKVTVIGIDADEDALQRAKETLHKFSNVVFVLSNFREMKRVLGEVGVQSVDKFVFDLGLSSDQLETSGRGFSFKKDEPLLMTFSKHPTKDELTAYDVVNNFKEENLKAIIKGFGEESFSGRIARAIVEAREIAPITSSKQLAEVVWQVVPAFYRRGKTHPATKTFQAIRMTVNNELETLEQTLKDAFSLLSKGGRIAVITFHSLEDRIVKNIFKEFAVEGIGTLPFKKPIVPTEEEIKENPRSRSSKLRVIEKTI